LRRQPVVVLFRHPEDGTGAAVDVVPWPSSFEALERNIGPGKKWERLQGSHLLPRDLDLDQVTWGRPFEDISEDAPRVDLGPLEHAKAAIVAASLLEDSVQALSRSAGLEAAGETQVAQLRAFRAELVKILDHLERRGQ